MPLRWAHAVVYVRDLDSMVDFYTGMLDFEVSDRGPIGPGENPLEIVFMSQVETDHHQLAFVPIRSGEEPPNSVDHFAFRVESLGDVRAYARKLGQDGRATQLQPLTHGNAWSIYFRDPEGNGIEIFCDTPWHVAQPQARPWDLELGDEALREWTLKEFENEPEFGPIDAFYAARAAKLRGG
jgi:catechol 2,3-dioxygenase-like lactoylglutathione lyase family enzyme